ncbi:CDP-glycerol glycerophosphotransferase family protein [Shimia sp. R10_1]|uniref:CDP-glycerol glycerophosphotransferase family protein n=1 Tax=Shimia sp. R10_1 TaxID=2821095 RepID=UPI001AD9A620|nr:CDP-glycerol glycerophosphotransferase family protein [Shimia sp. R10_1]MBO9473647.1 CDP-glycerol glycerophosphotransferase family protein [Shimia sp. R10_1]
MTGAALYLGAITCVLVGETWLRFSLHKAQRSCTVSSLTPQSTPVSRNHLSAQGLTATALLCLLSGLWATPDSAAPLFIALLPFGLRISLSRLTRAHIKRSAAVHSLQTLRHPKLKRARIALYFSEPRLATPYQVTMWLKPLLSLKEPFVILLKERKHLQHFPKSDLYEVLIITDLPEKTAFLPTSVEVLFYVNNSMTNLPVVAANPNVTHVQLLHGDSDKPPSYNPMSAIYDRLFVAGEMAIDRYARHGVIIPREKFTIVGRPQLPRTKNAASTSKACKTVVYMTTWTGMFDDSNFCSLAQAQKIVEQTLTSAEPLEVIFKPHPLSLKAPDWPDLKDQLLKSTNVMSKGSTFRIATTEEDVFDLYERADLLISDVSSTLIDFLATGKPYIVTNPNAYSETDLTSFPSVAGGYLTSRDASNLPDLMATSFTTDPRAQNRKALRDYALGDHDSPAGAAFQNACRQLLDDRGEKSPDNSRKHTRPCEPEFNL